MDARVTVAVVRTIFALLTLYAVGRQLAIHVRHGFDVTNFFSYFTNLSNIFAACVLLGGAALWNVLRAMAAINMLVVGIVFTLLLRRADLGALLPWVNFVVHYLMPCVVVLDWILLPPRCRLGARELLLCLVVPALYLSYVLIRGSLVGWYPYPFLNPANVGGYGGVAVYAVGVTAVFIVGGGLLFLVANKRLGHDRSLTAMLRFNDPS
jgi:hypothetical protein